MKRYSDKELEMIKQLSSHWYNLILRGDDDSITPPTVFRILAEDCFVRDLKGPAVESLRRCMKAIWESKIHRMTPEWDALIQLD